MCSDKILIKIINLITSFVFYILNDAQKLSQKHKICKSVNYKSKIHFSNYTNE